jgi:hypothetical protein
MPEQDARPVARMPRARIDSPAAPQGSGPHEGIWSYRMEAVFGYRWEVTQWEPQRVVAARMGDDGEELPG